MTTTDPTLADLIRDHMDRTGESLGTIAARGNVSKALVGRLALPRREDETYRVQAATVPKLATALNLPESAVQRAAARTAGYVEHEHVNAREATVERIAHALEGLDDRDVDTVLLLADALRKRGDRDGR